MIEGWWWGVQCNVEELTNKRPRDCFQCSSRKESSDETLHGGLKVFGPELFEYCDARLVLTLLKARFY
jgi:hypothetical protein